jgi:hypothetical protein
VASAATNDLFEPIALISLGNIKNFAPVFQDNDTFSQAMNLNIVRNVDDQQTLFFN